MKITGIDSHVYLVKDAARAVAFWRDVIGLHCSWSSEDGAEFDLPDGSSFSLWHMDDGSWTAGNGVMFAVNDINVALARLKEKGVHHMDYIEETPVCFMVFAEDTEGNAFVLHQRKPQ